MGHIKGVGLLTPVKVLRANRERALEVLPRHLHSYLHEKILITNWYPDDDFMGLIRALIEVIPDPGTDVWEWIGHYAARGDFVDIYSAMIVRGRPAETLRRYPRTWRLYHDDGVVKVKVRRNGAKLLISQYLVTLEEFCRLQTGHFVKVLELAEARDVKVRNTRVASGLEPASWDVSWSS